MRAVRTLLVILSGGCLFDAGGAVPESVSILLNAVHMKKTLLFSSRSLLTATLFFCAASVVSCQKEETAGAAPSCAAIRLTAEPAELVRTKSETDVAYASRFVEGDAIGLFAVIRTDAETQAYPAASGNYIQNAKFVRQADGSWREEGSKSYYMEQGQVMDLYAYYPYAENADPTALVYDASVAEADFMTARTPGFSERDGEIRLVFRHKLALAEAFVADADKLADYAVTVQDVRTKAVFSLAAAAQDAEMQSVDAKTASVAMTRCGNAFRAYLPAQEIAEGKALLKVEGNGFAAFDYTHPGKTSLAANQVRKLLVTPAFANPELLPNCYVVSPGETLYIPVSKAFGVWGKNDVLAGEGAGMLGAMGARLVWEDVRYLLNGDGNCYWSWHIWATEYDPSQVAGQQTVGGNVFMDRNLGATSLVKGPQSAGCFYQWGRKDPFQGPYTWMMFLNGNAGWSNDGIGKFMTLRGFVECALRESRGFGPAALPLYCGCFGLAVAGGWRRRLPLEQRRRYEGRLRPVPRRVARTVSGAGAASAWADLNGVWDAERTGCVFAEGNGYYPAAGYINIMSASGSGGGAEAGTSGYCWSASSAGKNGYALTYSVSAIKTEAEPSKTWACPVRCVKDVK